MENRIIKFRIWNNIGKRMLYDSGLEIKGCKVLSKFVMQFTGLKDKNRKEVYEGDIVKSFNQMEKKEVVFVVEFDSGIFECSNDDELVNLRDLCLWNNCEVIGNRYENLELLEDRK